MRTCKESATAPDAPEIRYNFKHNYTAEQKLLHKRQACKSHDLPAKIAAGRNGSHGYSTKEGCRTERKSRNLEYAMGVRLTGFIT
jgi:hypothetical protein